MGKNTEDAKIISIEDARAKRKELSRKNLEKLEPIIFKYMTYMGLWCRLSETSDIIDQMCEKEDLKKWANEEVEEGENSIFSLNLQLEDNVITMTDVMNKQEDILIKELKKFEKFSKMELDEIEDFLSGLIDNDNYCDACCNGYEKRKESFDVFVNTILTSMGKAVC